MKSVELVFGKSFKRLTRERSNPGVKAANLFWPQVLRHLEGAHTSAELVNNSVLKEHFSIGYTAAETLKTAFDKADQIKAVHHIDTRSLPTVSILFFKLSFDDKCFYELSTSFNSNNGAPLIIGRSERTLNFATV